MGACGWRRKITTTNKRYLHNTIIGNLQTNKRIADNNVRVSQEQSTRTRCSVNKGTGSSNLDDNAKYRDDSRKGCKYGGDSKKKKVEDECTNLDDKYRNDNKHRYDSRYGNEHRNDDLR